MHDFGLTREDLEQNMRLLRTGLRPISPDEMPIIGPLRQFPNVFLNVGYGEQGTNAFCGCKILEDII